MKLSIGLIASLTIAVMAAEAGPELTVAYFSHDRVEAAFANNSRLLDTPFLRVIASRRTQPGPHPVAHLHEAEVLYVIDGEGTMVTGGTLVGRHEVSPGEAEGTNIQGGQTYHLARGDVLVFPAGSPHWFKEVPHSINCLVVESDGQPPTAYFGHDKVEKALENSGTLLRSSQFLVMGSHRAENGHVEVHDKETDVFYITGGEATFLTGGRMEGGKVKSPGQWLGSAITGGEAHHLTKGDVIEIPAGTPHWYKEVPHSVTYFVVKVVRP